MKIFFLLFALVCSLGAEAKGYSKNFVFRYQATVPASFSRGDIQWGAAVCEGPVNLSSSRSGVRCALIGIYKRITISAMRLIVTRGGSEYAVLSDLNESFTAPYQNLVNIFRYVDTGQPLYGRMDLRDGAFYCGVDGRSLRNWNEYWF